MTTIYARQIQLTKMHLRKTKKVLYIVSNIFLPSYCTHVFTPVLRFSPLYNPYISFPLYPAFTSSLRCTSLHFPSLHFTSLHFFILLDDFHFTSFHFTSLPFTTLFNTGVQMETKPREYLRHLGLENEVPNPRTLSKYGIH